MGEKYTPITDSLKKLIESKRDNQVDEKTDVPPVVNYDDPINKHNPVNHFESVSSVKREINQIKREEDTSLSGVQSMDVESDWDDVIETQNAATKAKKRRKRFEENNHAKKKLENADTDSDVEIPAEVLKLKQSELRIKKKKDDLKNLRLMKLAG